jgi:carbon-monoxide dehydrogenase small subunit
MPDLRHVALTVNGTPRHAEADVRESLASVLRDHLGLTGTHIGCQQGACGACTVLVDGRSVRSCLMLAVQAQGAAVETIEGVAPPDGPLHPIQAALARCHGLQCGFCTPGIVMSLIELTRGEPCLDEAAVRTALAGHHCRCTGYQPILTAVLSLGKGADPAPAGSADGTSMGSGRACLE